MNSGTHADLRQAVKKLDVLPAMPVIAQKLLALRMDNEASEKKMVRLIEQDPQLTAKIIGLSNSSLIGSARSVSTLKDAVMLLGMAQVQTVSTAISIMSLMQKSNTKGLNTQDLWLHSFGVAFVMSGIARAMPHAMRPLDGQIFLAGLLHDIGYLTLAFLDPQRSARLHARLAMEPDHLALEVEHKMLELSHDELGAELARHWDLPQELVAVLRHHHTPEMADAIVQPLVRMISVAEKLLPSFGIHENVGTVVSAQEWAALGIDMEAAETIKAQVPTLAKQASQFVSAFS